MSGIAVIDVVVPAPIVIDVTAQGGPGPAGPPGPPGALEPHAATHEKGGSDLLTRLADLVVDAFTALRGLFAEYVAIGVSPAHIGVLRLSNADGGIVSRNAAGTGDVALVQHFEPNLYLGDESVNAVLVRTASGTVVLQGAGSDIPNAITTGLIAIGTNPAQSGAVRLPTDSGIYFRNGANTGDLATIYMDTNNALYLGTGSPYMYASATLRSSPDATNDLGLPSLRFRDLYLSRNAYVYGAVVNRTKAGTPVDGDVNDPADGMLIVDTTASKIWCRVGGVWKSAALT